MPAMPITVRRTAEITLALPRERAMAMFTPEGERRWAAGWEPHYPEPSRREGAGAVFTTGHGDHHTTWIMVDHGPDSVRYARVAHGLTAGIVAVDVLVSDARSTRVAVTYDLTALGPEGERWLAGFDSHYDAEITSWANDIASAAGSAPDYP
jgi:hypothetical protein